MSVEIDPLELGFRRPFSAEVAQVLKIKNPNTAPVAFKVKTTAPKQYVLAEPHPYVYCVRPNSGRIEAGREVEVSVLLQAMKQEPPPDAKCRDKFLVQSVTITADREFTNVAQIWESVEKSAIQEKKIRVAWLPPAQEVPSQPAVTPIRRQVANGYDATPDTAPPAYASPHDETTILDDSTAASPPEPREPRPEPETAPATQTSSAGAAPAKAAAAAETYEELADKLAKAEATIASLNRELASGGLRQRKAAASEPEEGGARRQQQQLAQAERPQQQQQQQEQPRGTEGVPVPLVALLCVFCFLLGYLLF
ncbi:69b9b279-f862-42b1-9a94-8cd192c83ca1 [Thermothielavioides terrestris]|uniref:69b9b279-f862-42b1-9a94-8cd192c83ca1 n=1 Tax=Thermothielavioides terrestris TaxID=2587410 RepID=A0A3S5CWG9_9PEZI|nr:69b9b279-f862-42b1-9a94-8cd192c83ca1 [Thermothielavioides terrestris]